MVESIHTFPSSAAGDFRVVDIPVSSTPSSSTDSMGTQSLVGECGHGVAGPLLSVPAHTNRVIHNIRISKLLLQTKRRSSANTT